MDNLVEAQLRKGRTPLNGAVAGGFIHQTPKKIIQRLAQVILQDDDLLLEQIKGLVLVRLHEDAGLIVAVLQEKVFAVATDDHASRREAFLLEFQVHALLFVVLGLAADSENL